jgi:competence protein ComEC
MAQVNITFLDVGQGDGTVISCPTGELMLIDLGSKKNAEIAGADAIKAMVRIIKASWILRQDRLKHPTLDYLLLTHGDGDHYNLVVPLIKAVNSEPGMDTLDILNIVIGGEKTDYDQAMQRDVLNTAEEHRFLTVLADRDHDAMTTTGLVTPRWIPAWPVWIYLLSANYPSRAAPGNKNPKSIVVMVEYGTPARKVILTGDAEAATEQAIIGYYQNNPAFLKSFGLKLGHHGSQAGTSTAWMEAVHQAANFVSSDMKWAHPYCETIARIVETIGPGAELYTHQWLCGAGAGQQKEYRNFDDQVGVYSTMAHMTGTPMLDPVDNRWYAPGLVQGVQYQLSIYENGVMQLTDTVGHDSGGFIPPDGKGGPFVPAPLPPRTGFAPGVTGD